MPVRSPKFLIVVAFVATCVTAPPVANVNPAPQDTHAIGDSLTLDYDESASTPELMESAREMFIAKSYMLSEMLYKAVLVREPENLSAVLELSIVYEALGRLDYARGLLARAATLNPHDRQIKERIEEIAKRMAEALRSEVDSLLAEGHYEAALPKISILLATRPEDAELHFRKAECHLSLGRSGDALDELDKAIHLYPDPRYLELRDRIERLASGQELAQLQARVKSLLPSERPDREQLALAALAQILEIDPDNKWARRQFRRLADTHSETPTNIRPGSVDPYVAWAITGVQRAWVRIVEINALLAPYRQTMLAILIALLLLNLTLSLLRRQPRHALAGKLRNFTIQEVLTLIQAEQGTGVLHVHAPAARGRVYFGKGEVYDCQAGRLAGRTALQHLIKHAVTGTFVFKDSPSIPGERMIETPLQLILMNLPDRQPGNADSGRRRQPSRMRELLKNRP